MDLKNINYLILLKNDEFVVINILRFSMRIGFRMALIKRRIPIKRHVITGILNLVTHTYAGSAFQTCCKYTVKLYQQLEKKDG